MYVFFPLLLDLLHLPGMNSNKQTRSIEKMCLDLLDNLIWSLVVSMKKMIRLRLAVSSRSIRPYGLSVVKGSGKYVGTEAH